jgi:formylglycine-generating enzyme required for sulfatase activity
MRSRRACLCGMLIMLAAITIGCGEDMAPPPLPVSGTITINPEPDSAHASWKLEGPSTFTRWGRGNATITWPAGEGSYTLTWGSADGWTAPNPLASTQVLANGGTLTFTGTYVTQALSGTITINPEPDSVNAPWQIAGPDDFTRSGDGETTITDMAAGSYILTWGTVDGWTAPSPLVATQVLPEGGTLTFTGTYALADGVPAGFVSISAGSFTMGSPADEPGRNPDETQHQVTLTHDLYVQTTEVTNQQYTEMAQWAYDNGYVTTDGKCLYDNIGDDYGRPLKYLAGSKDYEITFTAGVFSCTDPTHPVNNVTWFGSAAYCDWLSLQQGLPPAYSHSTWSCNAGNQYTAMGYRLPTEAEWEYACRAGTQTPFNTGSCLDAGTEANYYGPGSYTGCPAGPDVGWTVPVGSYPANAFGLYDMHGNLWEWCTTAYDTYGGAVTDPVGVGGRDRVLRGGRWSGSAQYCRSASRYRYDRETAIFSVGFRPVRSAN